VTDLIAWSGTEEVVLGADDHRSQPTHQFDFVDAVLELVKRGRSGLWHAAAEGSATNFEVAESVFEMMGVKDVDVRPLRKGAGRTALRPRFSVLDCSKLAAEGIRLRPWKDALREFLKSMAR
jgi:dTDP-4-dehydrorhamnose reductase